MFLFVCFVITLGGRVSVCGLYLENELNATENQQAIIGHLVPTWMIVGQASQYFVGYLAMIGRNYR
jgi:hypothetical protein